MILLVRSEPCHYKQNITSFSAFQPDASVDLYCTEFFVLVNARGRCRSRRSLLDQGGTVLFTDGPNPAPHGSRSVLYLAGLWVQIPLMIHLYNCSDRCCPKRYHPCARFDPRYDRHSLVATFHGSPAVAGRAKDHQVLSPGNGSKCIGQRRTKTVDVPIES